SQTPDSRYAVRVPLSPAVAHGTGDLHLWGINSWAHFMGDHAVVFNLFPLAPDRTLVRTKWLVHQNAVEGVDYDLNHLTSVWMETNRQDAALVESAHAGVRSAGYRPGPYSRFTERTLNDWTSWYVGRMLANGVE
ncbi:MAG: SRPBCC family protein, partial [Pseudomonadota bacterium]